MSRLLLVALLLPALPAAARPPAVFSAQESAVRAAAKTYAADTCKDIPSACDEVKILLGEYESALQSATRCEAGKCKLAEIKSLAKSVGQLDGREGALPFPPAGRSDRPLLALSSIATGRLTAAATRLGNPYAIAGYGPGARSERQKAVEGACVDLPAACSDMRALLATETTLTAELDACVSTKCPFERVDGLIEKGRITMSDYLALAARTKVNTLSIFSAVNDAHNKGIALYTPLADQASADFEAGTDSLGAKLDAAEKNAAEPVSGVDAAGRDLFEKQRQAALAADRLAYHLHYDPKTGSPARREKLNAVEAKLAGLRGRALALRAARGLGEDKGDAGVAASASGGAGTPATKTPLPLVAPAKTVLDKRLIPDPSPVSGTAPPILPGNPGTLQLLRNASSKDPVVRADAQRRLGTTTTVGNPGRYAPQAFTQDANDTCAIAVQVEILRAHGLLPTSVDAKTQELALAKEAEAKGYKKGGTPPTYSGSLLTDRGMIVQKKQGASWADLEESLRRGSPIQARVDARKLWKISGSGPLSHSILVSGAEISKINGKILGVYINDSGIDPPGAGQYLDAEFFKKAWTGDYAEVR